jgi:hypothetical protein
VRLNTRKGNGRERYCENTKFFSADLTSGVDLRHYSMTKPKQPQRCHLCCLTRLAIRQNCLAV